MTSLVLIGDSIRMGYQPFVPGALARLGLADVDVWGPEENGGHTVNVLVHLHVWVQKRKPQLVHFNAGLHDLKTVLYDSRQNLIPIRHYRQNVATIIDVVRQCGSGIIIANTTPVLDEPHNAAHRKWGDFRRFNEDVIAYNAALQEECQNAAVPVNDLYSVAQSAPMAAVATPDGVHFTEAGSRLLADAVAKAVVDYL